MGKRVIILWDNDIGWSEELRNELFQEKVEVIEAESAVDFLQEADVMKKTGEIILLAEGENAMAVVLSASQLKDELAAGATADEKDKPSLWWQEVLQRFCESCPVPVLFVAENYEEKTELEALQAGASDFFDKGRDIRICSQRILICGRKRGKEAFFSDTGEDILILDDKKQSVLYDGGEYILTQREYQVFSELWKKRGTVVSRQELLEAVWGKDTPKCCRVVDTVIKQLRSKIKDAPYVIQSKYRAGYYLGDRKMLEM